MKWWQPRLEDEDVICYILAGLDHEYNPFVAKTEPQTFHDLYSATPYC
jgi:hypothetical protein